MSLNLFEQGIDRDMECNVRIKQSSFKKFIKKLFSCFFTPVTERNQFFVTIMSHVKESTNDQKWISQERKTV